MSRNNIQHDAKIKVNYNYYCIIISYSRLVLYRIVSFDFPKIRHLPKIFLKSFENVAPDYYCTFASNHLDTLPSLRAVFCALAQLSCFSVVVVALLHFL